MSSKKVRKLVFRILYSMRTSTCTASSRLAACIMLISSGKICHINYCHWQCGINCKYSDVCVSADETEVAKDKLFEGDILLVEGDKPYGYRKRRSDIMTSSGQEANMMGMGGGPEYSHIWPNRTVYYTFAQTLGEFNTN